MVAILTTREHSYTFGALFDWAPDAKPHIELVAYEDALTGVVEARSPVVIFSDLDRLTRRQMPDAVRLADRYLMTGRRVLNHPDRFVPRHRLLRRLHDLGQNEFNAFTLGEVVAGCKLRFPVFIRTSSGHSGALTGLIGSRARLAMMISRQVARAMLGRVALDDLIVVEYQGVADARGLISKYSYFKAGEHLIARHVLFGSNWVLKSPEMYDEAMRACEEDFLRQQPDRDLIAAVFDLASVDYGRIDYSIDPASGKIQVWEINTNPSMAVSREKIFPDRREAQQGVITHVVNCLLDLDAEGGRMAGRVSGAGHPSAPDVPVASPVKTANTAPPAPGRSGCAGPG